jgi:hypothetical protein
VNQLDWLTGGSDTSRREGYIYWLWPEIYGVKWRNFKLVLVAQKYMQDPAAKLPTPRLITSPPTRTSVNRSRLPYLHSWVATHFNRIISEFQTSLYHEPLIPAGAPLDHAPTKTET